MIVPPRIEVNWPILDQYLISPWSVPGQSRRSTRQRRNVKEVLRVLDALQSDELCPCNWNKGESTLDT